MKIVFASRCQQGLRDENQDRTGAELDERKACFVVCDGVAGLPGGEMAAQLVRDTLLSQLQAHADLTPEITHQAIEQCRLALHEAQGKNPKYSRMSTTLAALFIDREKQRACGRMPVTAGFTTSAAACFMRSLAITVWPSS